MPLPQTSNSMSQARVWSGCQLKCLSSQGSEAHPSTAKLVSHSGFAKQWTSLPSAREKYFYCSISDSDSLSFLARGSDMRAETVLTDQHRVQRVHAAMMNSALSATELVTSYPAPSPLGTRLQH